MNIFRHSRVKSRLSGRWKRYVQQSLYAAMALFVVISLLQQQRMVIVASIGASAFIVFAMPQSTTAKPRNLIGGHLIGLLVGLLFSLAPQSPILLHAAFTALCVGGTVFFMVATDTGHPPAAGTALGVAMMGFSPTVVTSILASVTVLALAHRLLQSRLVDLT